MYDRFKYPNFQAGCQKENAYMSFGIQKYPYLWMGIWKTVSVARVVKIGQRRNEMNDRYEVFQESLLRQICRTQLYLYLAFYETFIDMARVNEWTIDRTVRPSYLGVFKCIDFISHIESASGKMNEKKSPF